MTTISTSRTIATDRIVAAAMTLVAELGLSGLTMRDLAQAVGKSTTVIVNRFGSKSGLIEAIATAAFEQDEVYHDTFFASVSELALSRDALLVLVGRYLRERALASANFVRVWEELLVSAEPAPFLPPLLVRWEAMRRKAWTAFLARTPGLATFGEAVSTYLIIEQFYAGALGGRADYEVIAAEGLGGLVDRAFGRRDDPASASESYVGRLAIPKAPADGLEVGSLKLERLDVAADQILTRGVAVVTNRSVSTAVRTSTSTIAYHWVDMRRFLIDAVWHAVFREMPGYLDYRHPAGDGPPDLQRWSDLMARTLKVGDAEGQGFYIKYARLIAQVCLKARRDPSFQELAMILRGPEGGGTYVKRAELWPAHFDLTRRAATRFALWIKGAAIMAGATEQAPNALSLQAAAAVLVAERG